MSNLGTVDIGDELTFTARFYDVDDVLTNPNQITWQVEQADGTEVSYDELDVEVDNPSTGIWTLTIVVTVNDPGRWHVRARGTAGVKAADEDWFDVRRSVFTTP